MAKILKKCDHTRRQWAKCQHKWTVRAWVNGHQIERSVTAHEQAVNFDRKIENDKRSGEVVYAPRNNTETLGTAAARYIERLPRAATTKAAYRGVLGNHIMPAIGEHKLTAVAGNPEAVADLVNVTMSGMSTSRRIIARTIITGTLDAEVKAGRLTRHRCDGIELDHHNSKPADRSDFVFPPRTQLETLAHEIGEDKSLAIWLMRGCGLRIQEALAVHRGNFRDNGTVLRVSEQVTRDGTRTVALKHRKPGEYRDVPVPSYLWDMVKDIPDGYLFHGKSAQFPLYGVVWKAFTRAAKRVGIQRGFTPHSLRHAFASALLARGVPITDVAKWLGHENVNVTFQIYGHLVPSAWVRARDALDAEWDAA